MAAVVGSSPIARSRKYIIPRLVLGIFIFRIVMRWESKGKYQLLLVFSLREPGDGGESWVPLLAPKNLKNSPILKDRGVF
jgi:hypothetical protein